MPDTEKQNIINVVVDNDSWVLPHAQNLVDWSNDQGHTAKLCRTHNEIEEGFAAFYLGCVKITPPNVLARNERNLVAHASDLPKGRGFSPWSYAILDGNNDIPLCLLEAVKDVDAGPIIYKENIALEGNELVAEVRDALGQKIFKLCQRFLSEEQPPIGTEQTGEPTYYDRRSPKESILDANKTIAEQFDLLRIVDNNNYPAFFEYRGRKYKLLIEPDDRKL